MPDQPEPFPGVFPGTLGAPPDVPALLAASDLVCVGRVRGRRTSGQVAYLVNGEPKQFRRTTVTVELDRVVKGTAGERIELEVLELDEPSGLVKLVDDERVLLFLVRRDDHCALTDPVTGAVDLDRPGAEDTLAQLEP